MKQLCLKTHWHYPEESMVRLFARNPEAKKIIKKESGYWTVRPLPDQTSDTQSQVMMQGWLFLRSMITTERWVHVCNDKYFDVLLYNDAQPYCYGKYPFKCLQTKGPHNV